MGIVRTDVIVALSPLLESAHYDVGCPAGKRMVVTNIDVGAGEFSFAPSLGVEDLDTGGTFFMATTSGVLFQTVQWVGRQAFNYGGGIRLNAHLGDWDIRVTGYFLDLP